MTQPRRGAGRPGPAAGDAALVGQRGVDDVHEDLLAGGAGERQPGHAPGVADVVVDRRAVRATSAEASSWAETRRTTPRRCRPRPGRARSCTCRSRQDHRVDATLAADDAAGREQLVGRDRAGPRGPHSSSRGGDTTSTYIFWPADAGEGELGDVARGLATRRVACRRPSAERRDGRLGDVGGDGVVGLAGVDQVDHAGGQGVRRRTTPEARHTARPRRRAASSLRSGIFGRGTTRSVYVSVLVPGGY